MFTRWNLQLCYSALTDNLVCAKNIYLKLMTKLITVPDCAVFVGERWSFHSTVYNVIYWIMFFVNDQCSPQATLIKWTLLQTPKVFRDIKRFLQTVQRGNELWSRRKTNNSRSLLWYVCLYASMYVCFTKSDAVSAVKVNELVTIQSLFRPLNDEVIHTSMFAGCVD